MRLGPVRNRTEFAALRARGVRSRVRSTIRVTYLAGDDGVRVAFAIGRHAGTAVRRNRLRRRLRAILAGLELPDGRYLLAGGAEATALPYDALAAAVRASVDDVVDEDVRR